MNKKKPRIMVAGVGGVGGLIASKLVQHYTDSVTLIARGARAEHLKSEGLKVNSDLYGDFTVYPAHVVERADGCEKQDLILISVKNAALEGIAEQIRGAVGPDTIIMPVMNGVTAADRIYSIFPGAHTMMSVIYTVSMVLEDYTVRQLGRFTYIDAGPLVEDEAEREKLATCLKILNEAEIRANESADVRAACWNKYILNSAYNGMTAAYDLTIGDIKHDEALACKYRDIMTEAYNVGMALGVGLSDDLIDINMRKLYKTTDDSTSSLSRDFDRHISGEYELFGKDIADMGRTVGIETPHIDKMHQAMLSRISSWK